MITIYQLYSLTGYHPHSRTKWTKKHFHITTKESKQVGYEGYDEAYELLKMVSKKPDFVGLHNYFKEGKSESHSEQLIDIMNKQVEEELKSFPANIRNGLNLKPDGFIPMITKDDYEVLKNSFDDLLEMYRGLEQRLLILEKRTELPERSYRNEVIALVNEIAHKQNKDQQSLYKSIYKAFDHTMNISEQTKSKDTKISYLEWYDKNGYLPKLLNFIRREFKV